MTEIDYQKLGTVAEKKNRKFIVECRDGIYNTKRIFEYKNDVRRFVERPHITNVRVSIEESEG